ncbi:hypothetical protein P4N68_01260 [Corynebacterium felinum]|uniref:Uncharacterized protein n=1 Tax=Corynebacterium felinum TaxID=131318 RepID=A0ABU2BAF4_9CORY|nr:MULTISPECIES: hypothetical protein [Corynebacterium]MDF5819708.1 hypothetical protein [Corynebacterium felinum]MDO4761907.1 hypothetical protein [Corynebacterium sp.]MDR7355575.1 hypothetical protein [Corynebacterium felinum]WJY94925.1 hypothetical protein CFELI_06540 [Corynebacterium felinum]
MTVRVNDSVIDFLIGPGCAILLFLSLGMSMYALMRRNYSQRTQPEIWSITHSHPIFFCTWAAVSFAAAVALYLRLGALS